MVLALVAVPWFVGCVWMAGMDGAAVVAVLVGG